MEMMTQPRAGEVFASRFEIDRVAGSGGMGTVYRARDLFSGDIIALKVLRPHGSDPHEADRFAREGQLLYELRHPGIVNYIAHGRTPDGQRYLAMEWLEGEDLARRLARGPLPVADSVLLLQKIADGLAVAHQRAVVHRDIKPSEVTPESGWSANDQQLCEVLAGTGLCADRQRPLSQTERSQGLGPWNRPRTCAPP